MRASSRTERIYNDFIRAIKGLPPAYLLREYFLDCPSKFGFENATDCSKISCTVCQLNAIGVCADEEVVKYIERHILKENV